MANGNGWPLRADGTIDVARWVKMWKVVLDDFDKPAYAATVETVAVYNATLAALMRNQITLMTTQGEKWQSLVATANSNVAMADALLATAQKTSDPSALFLAVAYPLAFQGPKSALHVTASLANSLRQGEPTYDLGDAVTDTWNGAVDGAGDLKDTVGEYLGKGLAAAGAIAKAGLGIGAVLAGAAILYLVTK